MGEYLAPGVFIEELAGPRPIEGVGTAVAAFVGVASKGKPNEPIFITSFSDYLRKFGDYRSDAFMPYAVDSYFKEGGTKAYIVRHVESRPRPAAGIEGSLLQSDGSLIVSILQDNGREAFRINFGVVADDETKRAQVIITNVITSSLPHTFDIRLINDLEVTTLTNVNLEVGSDNYLPDLAQDGITVEIENPVKRPQNGTYSLGGGDEYTNASVTIPLAAPNSGVAFVISNSTPGAAANGITINIGDGSDSDIFNMQIGSSDPITDLTMNSSDPVSYIGFQELENLTVSNIYHISPRVGEYSYSVQMTVESIATADILSLSGASRVFSVNSTSVGSWGNNIAISVKEATNKKDASFNLIVYEVGIVNGTKVYSPLEVYENISLNADDGSGYIVNAINGKSSSVEITNITNNAVPNKSGIVQLFGGNDDRYPQTMINMINTSLRQLDKVDGVTILVCPEFQDASDHRFAADYCESRKDCFYVGSVLQNDRSVTSIQSKRTSYGTASRSAIYAPWIKIIDPKKGIKKEIPPTGAIAGIYARTDTIRGVYKAPAGTIDGAMRSAFDVVCEFTTGEQELLNPLGINCIRKIPGAGIVNWGCRTLSVDAQWRYVNIRRLLIYIEKSIEKGIAWAVFEPNNFKLWSALRRDISGFLRVLWRDGGLFGLKEEDAFFVKIDEENNPPDSRDLGRLVINVGVAPIKPAEFVIIRIEQMMQKE